MIRFLIPPIVLIVSSVAQAATPEKMLQRMAETMHTVNYEGVMLHVQGDETSTMRIYHFYDPHKGVRERLVSMDGPQREVLHENGLCTCVWPESRLVVRGEVPAMRSQLSPVRFGEIDKISAHYQIKAVGNDRVAGLQCVLIRLTPRDVYRHGYQLCIHEASNMLLRIEVLNGVKRLEMNQFANLRMTPTLNEDLMRMSIDTNDFRVVEQPECSQVSPKYASWHARKLPPGFELKISATRKHPHTGKPLEHLIFSDGLANVSVFIEPKNEKAPRSPRYTGAMHRLVRESDAFRMTAVGEAPVAAMEMILGNLVRGEP